MAVREKKKVASPMHSSGSSKECRESGKCQTINWYALFVCSNQEKRIAQGLDQRGVEHFLPCYRSVRQWKDRRVKIEVPLFPGYVFVRLRLIDRLKVLAIPHVVALVGTGHSPSVISEEEIEWIRRGIEHGKAEPYPSLHVGERVVIADGVMSGLRGVLLRRQNNTRVVVSVDSIGRSFVVDIEEACLRSAVTVPN